MSYLYRADVTSSSVFGTVRTWIWVRADSLQHALKVAAGEQGVGLLRYTVHAVEELGYIHEDPKG